jgi:hypothetical protein
MSAMIKLLPNNLPTCLYSDFYGWIQPVLYLHFKGHNAAGKTSNQQEESHIKTGIAVNQDPKVSCHKYVSIALLN